MARDCFDALLSAVEDALGHVEEAREAVGKHRGKGGGLARFLRRAALAPADPSAQDRAVAAQAQQMAIQAQAELARQRMEAIRARQQEQEGSQRPDRPLPTLRAADTPAAPTALTLAEPPEGTSLNLDEVV